ncbi:MAG: hypothetical protein NTY95_18510 [Bacteroidia bacterium]|jgi:hypothetical protein|nr:hypothetical protein [Bacteroidia bacterium]
MKTLGKLNINSEKIMKKEELQTLRGGYGSSCDYLCYVYVSGTVTIGVGCGTGVLTVQEDCNNYYSSVGGHCSCIM